MRWAKLFVVGAVLVTGYQQPAQAQEEKEQEKECICEPWGALRVFPRRGDLAELVWFGRHARLGVYVNTEANPETDRYGALITGVSEGGPADEAGLKKGDIITKLDGESLLRGEESYDEDESAPGMRLIQRARELERGDTVEVEYRRDGSTKTTKLVAGGLGQWAVTARALERAIEIPEVRLRAPESFALRLGMNFPGLELVSLNPDLGEYFGAQEGVLVVSVPEDSELNLKAGDVIQAIDGRKVKSPTHAMRILRSYEPDEEVSFDVLRKKKTTTVTGKVTEARGLHGKVLHLEKQD